jgi:hypothetical protein
MDDGFDSGFMPVAVNATDQPVSSGYLEFTAKADL